MDSDMTKSASDPDIQLTGIVTNTPQRYVFPRLKRSRDEFNDAITKQLDELRDDMRQMISRSSHTNEQELKRVTAALKDIQESNLRIGKSMEYLTLQNEEFKKKIAQLENQSREGKKYIAVLEDKIEDLQMGSRKANFEIKNVPKKQNETKEDLIEMALCLSQTIDCKISKTDIKDIFRVRGKNNDKPSPIIVETGSTLIKTNFLRLGKSFNVRQINKLCCKHLGLKFQEDTPVFLGEHLTMKGSRLHFRARDLVKSMAYKFCWTAYGKVFVRKDENSTINRIRNEEQVHQLLLRK
ncbi:uncharacterized protein LOC126966113 [Leptidea sinapis]|uniref:uncharacterized protein LOC126966113 n=1 Tax=Leptidea sinapis TaxID=189913 RepID=UPI0021C2E73D|nr:uncharacterized protein LOC126966113 [Leptidea sinapis]